MKKYLTIVIPCKNEGRGIIEVLKLLVQQTDCRIIIADSSDDEGSFFLIHKYSSIYSNVEIIDGGLPSIARNKGAKLVKTPYVLFLDADTYIFDPFLLKNCLLEIINGNYDLVTCKFKTDRPYKQVYRIFDIVQKVLAFFNPFALGGFMLFKTETFNKLGGFNEEDKVAEDYRLSSKIKPEKFKIFDGYVYTPNRRFRKKGLWYMITLMLKSWLNKSNDEFFKHGQNYWNEKEN